MQFQVLGCGTSTGVPVPGCQCDVCSSSNPKNNRLRTSGRLILDSGECILFDAGNDLRAQCLQFNITRIDAILFTHYHSDHILGIHELRAFQFLYKQPIPCYGNEQTFHEIERIFSYLFTPDPDYEGGMLTSLTLNRIQHAKPFTVFQETITPFPLFHGKVPVIGYRVRDFVYATDCNVIPPESKEIMRGAKVLILDGLRHRPHKTHFTISEAAAMAAELEAENTYLIHMSHDVEYEETQRLLPPNVQLAYDGLTIHLT